MPQTKFAQIKIAEKDFSFFSHRGFGERTYARYVDIKRWRYVHNQLSGLEIGIENGADTLELDLSKTKDRKIITAHGNPLQKYLSDTEQEYLQKYPEALTFQELLDWICHQPSHISLYLELKSPITIKELLQEINLYAERNHQILHRLYQQLILYTHDLQIIRNLIREKQQFGLSTLQLRIFWVSMGFIGNADIDMISQIGTKGCHVHGVEQGTIPWGFKPFVYLLNLPLPPSFRLYFFTSSCNLRT
jgi:glycerophosphoryl diester phosphodiesterase